MTLTTLEKDEVLAEVPFIEGTLLEVRYKADSEGAALRVLPRKVFLEELSTDPLFAGPVNPIDTTAAAGIMSSPGRVHRLMNGGAGCAAQVRSSRIWLSRSRLSARSYAGRSKRWPPRRRVCRGERVGGCSTRRGTRAARAVVVGCG